MTAPADTLVYDTATVAIWQSGSEYDYNRELQTPEVDLIGWLNLWLGKLLQKIFGSKFAEQYTEIVLAGLFILIVLLLIWFLYKRRPELFMRSGKKLAYHVEEDTIYGSPPSRSRRRSGRSRAPCVRLSTRRARCCPHRDGAGRTYCNSPSKNLLR